MGSLFSTKDSVAAVAETGADITLVIELAIQVANKNLDIGMDSMELFQTFRCCNNAQEVNVLATVLLDEIDGFHSGTAGCQHGIHNINGALTDVGGEFAEVLMGLQGLFIAVDADVTDLGGGHQAEHTVDHTQTGSQNGNNSGLLAGDHGAHGGLQRSFDGDVFQRHILEGFIADHHGNFVDDGTELIGAGGLLSDDGELMFDQGMIANRDVLDILVHIENSLSWFGFYCISDYNTKAHKIPIVYVFADIMIFP